MSDPAEKLELVEEPKQIKKIASYQTVKNKFNIMFLQNVLGEEIKKLVKLQNDTVTIMDEIIKRLKEMPLNGG